MRAKRDVNIEFVRVVGCLIVIALHVCTWYKSGDKILPNALLIRCFLNDGVPLFWYVMGYFLFANPNASNWKRFTKAMRTLVLPAFGVMVFAQIWQDWVQAGYGKVSFWSCLDMHSFDAHNLFSNLLKWSSNMTFGGHLWYVFSYLEVLLWVPLLKYVCVNNPEANKNRRYLMLLTALFVIKRDISNITDIVIAGKTYAVTIPTVITSTLLYVVLGYELSIHRADIEKHKKLLLPLGFASFILCNLGKYYLSAHFVAIDAGKTHFIGISSSFAYIASLGLFVAVLCLPLKRSDRVEKLVFDLASTTLGVYLIHTCVYRKVNALGVRSWIFASSVKAENLLIEVLCTSLYTATIFLVSYLLVKGYRMVKKWMLRLFAW